MCFHAVYNEVEILSSAVQISDARNVCRIPVFKKQQQQLHSNRHRSRRARSANEGQHISVFMHYASALACADLLYFYIIKLLPYGWQILLCLCINFELA